MPVTVSYPGVYLEEVAVQTPTVVAATTSNAAVIDYFAMGPVTTAVAVTSMNQFNSTFGGVNEASEGSYAVQQFFLNGGSLIWVVRVVPVGASVEAGVQQGTPAQYAYDIFLNNPSTSSPTYYITAANPGAWGNSIATALFAQPLSPPQPQSYTFYVGLVPPPSGGQYTVLETYYNASLDPTASNFLGNLVNGVSQYVLIQSATSFSPPTSSPVVSSPPPVTLSPATSPPTGTSGWSPLGDGYDGTWANDGSDFLAALMAQLPVPLGGAALDLIAPQVFNILLLPAASILPSGQNLNDLIQQGINYCQQYEAFFIVDPPPPSGIFQNQAQVLGYPWIASPAPNVSVATVNSVGSLSQTGTLLNWSQSFVNTNNYSAATYYPWLLIGDSNNPAQARYAGPSGTMAGVYATNDLSYGVWNAPAGTNAVLLGANFASILTDTDSGNMNPQGLNALRSFPGYGNVSWGARSLAGSNLLESTFKYINVRRLTDFIEQSLYQSLKWAVFQPNAAPLWASITQEVTAFMSGLFSQGAFQGTSASQAYFVQCGPSTTTQQDIINGIVNVVVGFAPVLPAEFVILQIQVQLTPFSASS